jgi:tRNA (guanine-N7-)-methyltransferase
MEECSGVREIDFPAHLMSRYTLDQSLSALTAMTPISVPAWAEIFGNTNPVEVEIGPGKGSFLIDLARATPEHNFFGVEFAARRAFRVARLIERDGPDNVVVIRADFTCLVRTHIYPESVAVYHVYFPDPWWKTRHRRRRIFQADFAGLLARTLVPGGTIFFVSDVQKYFEEVVQQFTAVSELRQFSWQRDQVTPKGRLIVTDFEQKYQQEGRAIYYAGFRKKI